MVGCKLRWRLLLWNTSSCCQHIQFIIEEREKTIGEVFVCDLFFIFLQSCSKVKYEKTIGINSFPDTAYTIQQCYSQEKSRSVWRMTVCLVAVEQLQWHNWTTKNIQKYHVFSDTWYCHNWSFCDKCNLYIELKLSNYNTYYFTAKSTAAFNDNTIYIYMNSDASWDHR